MFIKGLDFNWSLPLPNDVFTRVKVRKPSTIYKLTNFFTHPPLLLSDAELIQIGVRISSDVNHYF